MSSTDSHNESNGAQQSSKDLEDSHAAPEVAVLLKKPSKETANEDLESPEFPKTREGSGRENSEQAGIGTTTEGTHSYMPRIEFLNDPNRSEEPNSLEDSIKEETENIIAAPEMTPLLNMLSTEVQNELKESLETPKTLEESDRGDEESKEDNSSLEAMLSPSMPSVEARNESKEFLEHLKSLIESDVGETALKENIAETQTTHLPTYILNEPMESLDPSKSSIEGERKEITATSEATPLSTNVLDEPKEFLESKSLEDTTDDESERKEITAEPVALFLPSIPSAEALNESNGTLEPANSLDNSDLKDLKRPGVITDLYVSIQSKIPSSDNSNEPTNFLECPNLPEKPKRSAPENKPSDLQGYSKCPIYSFSTKSGKAGVNGAPPVVKKYDDLVKLRGDKNEYRGLELTNKMKVLLISDPNADKAAVSLDVDVGNLSDPDELPGLAHFCEHMLFLGSEKYPEITEYSTFLSEHGGSADSGTYANHTNFYFDVLPNDLDEALDIFVQFFISPLFTESGTESVLEIIQSEYEENLENDDCRWQQLEKSTSLHTHPFHNFAAGNRETLEATPKSLNIDVRRELLEFYNKWYSSNLMTLVVLGKQSLDELEGMVASRFSSIEDKLVTRQRPLESPFPSELLAKRTYYVPVEDIRKINIVFLLPDITQYTKSSPWSYISYLIGNEGPGSLYQACASNGWCKSLDVDIDSYHGYSVFKLSMNLTKLGLFFIDDIVDILFQYITVLKVKGPKRWVFEELSHIHSFFYTQPPKEMVRNFANVLQDIPMEDVLSEGVSMSVWDPKLIMEHLSVLTPANMRVTIAAKDFSEKCIITEPWYGTKYFQEDINESLILKWSNSTPIDTLHMPIPNEFLPTDFTIFKGEDNTSKDVAPIIITDTKLMRVWYQHDTELLEPNGYMHFDICSPLSYSHPVNCILNKMLVMLLSEKIQQYSYAAQVAGIQWDVLDYNGGFTVTIDGLSDKQHRLLDKIIDHFVNFNVNLNRFKIMKDIVAKELQNADKKPLHKIASSQLMLCLTESIWTTEQRLEALKVISPKLLDDYVTRVLTYIHIEALICGNFTKDRALEIVDSVEKKFPKYRCPIFAKELLFTREIEMERGAWYVREIQNNVHKSSCTSLYYSCGVRSSAIIIMLRLLTSIIKKPCQDMLKPKEGSVHNVLLYSRVDISSQGLVITVEGDSHPRDLDQNIESFIQHSLKLLENITEEEFVKHKTTLTATLLSKPETLFDKAIQYTFEIYHQIYNFDKQRLQAEQLNIVTKEGLIQFYKNYIVKDAPERRKISIHIISTSENGKNGEVKMGDGLYEELLLSEEKTFISTDAPRRKITVQIVPRENGDTDLKNNGVNEDVIIKSEQMPTMITDVLEFQNRQRLFPRPDRCIDIPRKPL